MHGRDLGVRDCARGGRQHIYELEGLYFDGVSLATKSYAGFVFTTFSGIPVHLFENQLGDDWGDWLAGGTAQWTPVTQIRLRFDYIHLKDEASGFRLGAGKREDDLFAGSVWFDLNEFLTMYQHISAFSDQLRDLEIAATFADPKKGLAVRLSAYRLLQTDATRPSAWDLFSPAGQYKPFTQFSLNVTKGVGSRVTLDGGADLRMLDADQIASAFNHGYQRVYLGVSTHALGVKGMDLSLTGDYYHGSDNTLRNDYFGASFLIAQMLWRDRLKLGAGTSYYLFRYNLLAGNESSNVQTYYADVRITPWKPLEFRTGYEFEHSGLGNFHTARARVTWNLRSNDASGAAF